LPHPRLPTDLARRQRGKVSGEHGHDPNPRDVENRFRCGRPAELPASGSGQVAGKADNVVERPPILGGEDFSQAGVPIASLHSDLFAPVPAPTIRTGARTMSMAALNLPGK
jgi:hypothetical protein